MKIHFMIPSVLLMAVSPFAAADEAPARLMYPDNSNEDVIISEYRKGYVTYRMHKNDLNRKRVSKNKFESIYFYKPPLFNEAMELYQSRKYEEAKAKFAECETAYKKVDEAPNNYASLAGFYKLECCRRLFQLDELSSGQEKFRSGGLTREFQLQQLEVNAFWEAVRLKSWDRLDRLAQSWRKRKVTGPQRAQISYCHGLALEQLAKKDPKRLTDALNAYNMALSADFSASHEIVIAAASNALGMYWNDPKVQLAIKLWGTEDENKGSAGYQRLLEANTLMKLYQQAGWDALKKPSPDYLQFLKYEGTGFGE